MQMVKQIFIFIVLLWFSILLFMPKQELYYKLEKELEIKNIKINEESINTGLFSLTLNHADIYVKGIKLATAEEIDFFTLLFYSKVEFQKLILDSSLSSMAPTDIEKLTFSHFIWNPLNISVNAQGTFGALNGDIYLSDQTVRLDFNESKSIEKFKSKLKQDDKGWYYETSF